MRPLLSAAMIVRDEAAMLPACLESLAGVVDEVVIADTGSRDQSREIARSFGAVVFDEPWRDDFGAARNAALARARGEWILYIDADERLRPVSRAALEVLLKDPTQVAYRLRFVPRTGHTAYWEYRLFRNDPRIRFERAMHEKIPPAIARVAKSDGLGIGHADLVIDHVGYDGDLRRKHERNLPLLRKQLRRTPDDLYNLDHLGRTLEALGDGEGAVAAWRRAREIVRERDRREPVGSLPFVSWIRFASDRGEPYDELLAEAEARWPDHHELRWIRARSEMAAGRWQAALPHLEALAAVDADGLVGDQAFDRRIFEEFAWRSLGVCHFELGDYAASAGCFARAEALAPGDASHAVRRRLAEARAAAQTRPRPESRRT